MPVQSAGTAAVKILPPVMFLYCADGLGTGCPGVPVDASPWPPCGCCFALARSAIDLAGGSPANLVFIGWNSAESAVFAMVSASASLLMYCVRLPGFGWLLIHCGVSPPLLCA